MQNFINNIKNNEKNINNEYDLYEKKQIFLDNINVQTGNDILWFRDDDTICISKDRDHQTYSIDEIEDIPPNANVRRYI